MRLVIAVSIFVVMAFVACQSGDDAKETLSECSPEDARTAVDALQPFVDEYLDDLDRAGSTSRIALAPVIGDMQETRRELRRLEIPTCAAKVRDTLADGMDETIEAFLAFQAEESESVITRHFEKATELIGSVTDDLAELKIDALLAD